MPGNCCICGCELEGFRRDPLPVCAKPCCRYRYGVLPRNQVCVECGQPLKRHERGMAACSAQSCRFAVLKKRLLETQTAEALAHVELRGAAARRKALRDPETFPIVALPTQRNPLGRVGTRRTREFRQHVETLVAQAFALNQALPAEPARQSCAPVASSPAGQLTRRACTLCKGQCCISGGHNQAWVTADTISRYRREHPGVSASEMVSAYIGAIGSRTYRHSCIYHGRHGCSLSRELRSDTCNNYYCTPVRQFHEQASGASPARAFLVFQNTHGDLKGCFVEKGA